MVREAVQAQRLVRRLLQHEPIDLGGHDLHHLGPRNLRIGRGQDLVDELEEQGGPLLGQGAHGGGASGLQEHLEQGDVVERVRDGLVEEHLGEHLHAPVHRQRAGNARNACAQPRRLDGEGVLQGTVEEVLPVLEVVRGQSGGDPRLRRHRTMGDGGGATGAEDLDGGGEDLAHALAGLDTVARRPERGAGLLNSCHVPRV